MTNDLKTGGQTPRTYAVRTDDLIDFGKPGIDPNKAIEIATQADEEIAELKARLAAHAEDRAILETIQATAKCRDADIEAAFKRIRALAGATDSDPMAAEVYVERALRALTAQLEPLRAFILQMAGAPNSQVSLFVRAACSAALSNQPEPKLPPGDPLKTIAALTAQLDAESAARKLAEQNAHLAAKSIPDGYTAVLGELADTKAQLDAARRERDEANAELDRAKGLIVRALDSAETHSENTRTAIAGIAKLQSVAIARMAELAALRAELEAVKAQLDSYRTHTL